MDTLKWTGDDNWINTTIDQQVEQTGQTCELYCVRAHKNCLNKLHLPPLLFFFFICTSLVNRFTLVHNANYVFSAELDLSKFFNLLKEKSTKQ